MSILLGTYTAGNAENDSIATLSKKQQTITRSYQSYLICPLNGLSLKTPLIQYDYSFVEREAALTSFLRTILSTRRRPWSCPWEGADTCLSTSRGRYPTIRGSR